MAQINMRSIRFDLECGKVEQYLTTTNRSNLGTALTKINDEERKNI